MFTLIGEFLAGIANQIGTAIITGQRIALSVRGAIVEAVGALNIPGLGAIVAGVGVMVAFISAVRAGIAAGYARLGSIAGDRSVSLDEPLAALGACVELANYIVDLNWLFTIASGLAALAVACWVYRLIKSWIPTVS